MQEQMELLKELQGIDHELNKIRKCRGGLDAEKVTLCSEVERVRKMLDDLEGEIAELDGQRQEMAQALIVEQGNVERSEGRLPDIKTQKEYVAVLKEIDTAKKLNKELQDQIQGKDAQIETLNNDREEKMAEHAAAQQRVDARLAEIDEEGATYDKSLNEMDGRREALLEKLPVPVRKRYQQLLDRRGGIAVVAARNGACLGCNMQLPPQLYNSLYRLKEIVSCPHCNRLIYIDNEN